MASKYKKRQYSRATEAEFRRMRIAQRRRKHAKQPKKSKESMVAVPPEKR